MSDLVVAQGFYTGLKMCQPRVLVSEQRDQYESAKVKVILS